METALRFAQVGKRYGATAALTDVSLEVGQGEAFGLVGVNGAGKTTLIKCLLDFCGFDTGTIEIFGLPHRAPASRARLAFLPERFNPPYFLTGREFVQQVLALHRVPYDEERVRGTFESLDLDPQALSRPARAYSKGMTQKLGLAACLLSGKDLFVLDEPTGGLDPRARARVKRALGELRAAGRTLFLTTHSLSDVWEMCDRMAVLHGGRVRFAGPPRELAARHASGDLEQAFLSCIEEESRPRATA